jgi:hypothetical protein
MASRSFLLVLLAVCTCCVSAISEAAASTLPKSVTLSYEIIGTTAVKPLVTVFYDPKTSKHSLASWTPPSVGTPQAPSSEPTSSKLLRVLLPDGSSTITTLDTFGENVYQKIDLVLSPEDGSVLSASVSSLSPPPLNAEEDRYQKKVARAKAKGRPIPPPPPVPNTKKAREEAAARAALHEPVRVNIVSVASGPLPALATRAPPQVDAEGRELPQAEQQEKSFFQKYWWVFLIATMLMMTGGGGGEK